MISEERSAYLNVWQIILNLSNISLCRIDYLVQLKRLGSKNQAKAFDCLKSPKVKCQELTEKEMVTWILTSILPTCPLENIWTMLEELIALSCIACNGYNLKEVDYLWSLLGNSMD